MSRVVVDIETVGEPLESFDDVQQEYLLKFSDTEEKKAETIQKFSLYPTTAHIIVIGMLNPDTGHGKVLFQSEQPVDATSDDGSILLRSGTETELLSQFWLDLAHYEQFITFNGRGFDCPFLMLRSAILGVQPSRNLMPYRYDSKIHCDLLEQLTFYGALRKFNLDFYCKSFGIESPKSHGITGLDLRDLYEQKRFREIAEYNLGDLRATAELFRRWEKYLNVG
ncbi:MAG TPA: ribonuclease H-like domain-containing protein [Bacteroidota bacterium]|nr:ribonuclease H-like domain-containing protein [Bacteroidota bacterium]